MYVNKTFHAACCRLLWQHAMLQAATAAATAVVECAGVGTMAQTGAPKVGPNGVIAVAPNTNRQVIVNVPPEVASEVLPFDGVWQ